jgi:uncharacterized protein YkwD
MKKLMILSLLMISFSAKAQSAFEKAIVVEINKFRVENGLDTLVWSSDLYKASTHHATWASLADQSSHEETFSIGNLKTLKTIEDRFREYNCTGWNENIATLYGTKARVEEAGDIVDCWERSPVHRENLLFDRTQLYSPGSVKVSVTAVAVSAKVCPKSKRTYIVMNIGVARK